MQAISKLILHPIWAIKIWRAAGERVRLMKILGKPESLNDFLNKFEKMDFESMDKESKVQDAALDALVILVLTDPNTTFFAQEYAVTKEQLKEYYRRLLMAGAGQWQKGSYVPAVALSEAPTLFFLLKTLRTSPYDNEGDTWRYIAARLIEYYMSNQIGQVMDIYTGRPA